jgi:prepilin-type N-terminal cleavage/methylation domain-containing protein
MKTYKSRSALFTEGIRRAKLRSKRAFTLMEILVVLAIVGFAYYATIYTNLGTTRQQGGQVSAEQLQTQLASAYGAWTAAGGTHTATTTHDIAHESQFAYDLMTVLNSAAGTNAAAPAHFANTGVADGSATVLPTSNAQRIQLASTPADPGTTSTTGVVYGPYFILFEPTTAQTGIWQVTSSQPVAIP